VLFNDFLLKNRLVFFLISGIMTFGFSPAWAQTTTTWNGSAWVAGSGLSVDSIPNANNHVVIGSGTFTTSINSNFHCKNLTIESGATLVIVSGDTISVSGVVTNNGTITNNGHIMLRSCGTYSVQDIDGNSYKTVQIGSQCWIQNNLKVSKYRNGNSITTGLSDLQWSSTTSGAYAIHGNSLANDTLYGKLYNWYAVNDSRGICPVGWHVPSYGEWTTLTNYLDTAKVIYHNLAAGGGAEASDKSFGNIGRWAQQFTASNSGPVANVKLNLYRRNTQSGTFDVQLWSGTDTPTTILVTLKTINWADVPLNSTTTNTNAFVEITSFTNNYTLQSGSSYWLVISQAANGPSAKRWSVAGSGRRTASFNYINTTWTNQGTTVNLGAQLSVKVGVSGGKMKSTPLQPTIGGWNVPNTGASNSSGFTGMPGGYRATEGHFDALTYGGYWWSSSNPGPSSAWLVSLNDGLTSTFLDHFAYRYGFSIRCIRDLASTSLPTVTTSGTSSVTSTGANTGGQVTASGGGTITARGVVYGTSSSPTLAGSFTYNGNETGSFTSTLSGLNPSTTYHIRAYATNTLGTAYGNQVSFTTSAPAYPAGTVHCSGSGAAVVEVINPSTGKTWMDRNLGASRVATSRTDADAYGDLYQWGRRSDGHQCRNSSTTSSLSSIDQPAHGHFITTTSSDWRSPLNDNLWQGVSGTNNPCPEGFRLPTISELDAERLSWTGPDSVGAVGAYASPLKWTQAGHRRRDNASLTDVGSIGFYWSSTIGGSNAQNLYFDNDPVYNYVYDPDRDDFDPIFVRNGNSSIQGNFRATGFSVRCIKN
jgi:uncharacterized protein (TIGR02145 family)